MVVFISQLTISGCWMILQCLIWRVVIYIPIYKNGPDLCLFPSIIINSVICASQHSLGSKLYSCPTNSINNFTTHLNTLSIEWYVIPLLIEWPVAQLIDVILYCIVTDDFFLSIIKFSTFLFPYIGTYYIFSIQ
jgi:hypothetical protein